MALLLFDIDGTLLQPRGMGRRAFEAAVVALYGRPPGEAFPFDGLLDTQIASRTLSQLGRDPSEGEVARLLAAYVERLPGEASADPSSQLCPGVPAILTRLKSAGHEIALLTGNVRRGAEVKLGLFGLASHFSRRSGPEDLLGAFGEEARERHGLVPIAIERCEEAFGRDYAPDCVWLVGDSVRDVEAARLAGVRSLAVATGLTSERALREALPDRMLPDLRGADRALHELAREGRS